ncbi:MAG: NBR1-Ig-like domain-containing protein, partial [Chloroflexota bacterium]
MTTSKPPSTPQIKLWIWLASGLIVLALIVLGVLVAMVFGAQGKPIVVINAPAAGSQFGEGQAVAVQSTATDPKGVVKIVLSVDNLVIQEDKIDPPQTALQRNQTWNASGVGAHTIIVRAFRADGTANDPVSVSVTVVPQSALPTPTATPSGATPTPMPPPPGCVNASALVSDNIMVPDGTSMQPGQSFNKVWRVLNTGTCPWNAGYQLILVGGEAMSNQNTIAIPYTPVGAMFDLSVAMTAPVAPGPHVGQWRLRGADGQTFGALLDARINVVNPQPTPVCTGSPNITAFTASSLSIPPHTAITLNWGATNVSATRIDPGVGAVQASGSLPVVVDQTTTFTFTAYCGGASINRQVTVNVVAPVPTATPIPPTPKPTFRVTGASMNVSPSNYVGHCPGHFYYTGSITTNDAGAVTYRWVGANTTSPSPVMTFYAPGAGTHQLPGYSQEWGTKGGLWAQVVILTPNQLNSNQASFTNSCADPTPIPPTATHVPPTATHVPPTATHVPPTNTPVPQRRNISGNWHSGKYIMELTEAIGCPGPECGVHGRLIETTSGAPIIDDLSGTVNVHTGAVSLILARPGAMGGFTGTL